ncbi:hypothetical protein ACQPZG_04985 (plasmid) [Streptomyces sp. CA-294286]|uniref:hypothetical protein n=1 Tax=Streptomyces sp. CA-294286 TaxID=3240070 RepID=UPI003D94FD6E
MGSLPEGLQAREHTARWQVEELQAEAAELAERLDRAREALSRLVIMRETVEAVLSDMAGGEPDDVVEADAEASAQGKGVEPSRQVGVMMVPPWREGLVVAVLPDIYRDVVEIVADAPGQFTLARQGPGRDRDNSR